MSNVPEDVIPSFADAKRSFEIRYVTTLLRYTRGNVTQAARIAKKHRSDFHCLLRKLEIQAEDFRRPQDADSDSNSAGTRRSFDEDALLSLRPHDEP